MNQGGYDHVSWARSSQIDVAIKPLAELPGLLEIVVTMAGLVGPRAGCGERSSDVKIAQMVVDLGRRVRVRRAVAEPNEHVADRSLPAGYPVPNYSRDYTRLDTVDISSAHDRRSGRSAQLVNSLHIIYPLVQ